MSVIVDRRATHKNKLAGSRAKFIERYKAHIKGKIDDKIKSAPNIKDINKKVKVKISAKSLQEECLGYSGGTDYKQVLPGNDKWDKGDRRSIYPKDPKTRGGGNTGEGFSEDLDFTLSREEFLELLFEGMSLPNFIKKNNSILSKIKYVTGGFIKEGIPTRLSIKKTLEVAMARRIAFKNSEKKPRFIDETDLRYRHYVPEIKPISRAVMFCIMDVSGSMTEKHRFISKKFFLLLYLFLEQNYKEVEVRFIQHSHEAMEVKEAEFFKAGSGGGTCVSPAIELVRHIIQTEYDVETTNIYIAQASDGDNSYDDYELLTDVVDNILPLVQYFAYIEVDDAYVEGGMAQYYEETFDDPKLNTAVISSENDVFDALRALFLTGKGV